ncbi:MAG TPA: sugar ABC transporter permease [Geminicoccus sp.]|uniref:carbohydrate ABC transporter permease n=1 Tax=Geminicoccus sp. TaxID=2024832 RepID=UPI002D0AF944|nr:sugar ABC transporter permease [Geminicoccus sp.]HWL67025.1 sugar ABC transporter permease [Geminicoccus sp.]
MARSWDGGRQEVAVGPDRWNPFGRIAEFSERRHWAWFLLLPCVLIVALIVIYPTFYGITLSFREMRLTRPGLGTGFVGLKHYLAILQDGTFWLSVRNTLAYTSLAIVLELSLGLASALALNQRLPGLRFLGVVILLPWFLPNVVAGNMWALMLDPRLGVINDLLVRAGILDGYRAWFADPATALIAAVVVEAWHGFPFFTLLLLAALKGVPDELHQSAAVDGATVVDRFWHVTLPMLKMVIVAAVVLRVISIVNSPDLLLILTNGGPANSTMVLSLYAFQTAYRAFDFGYAGALSVVMLLLLMLFCFLYVRASNIMANS